MHMSVCVCVCSFRSPFAVLCYALTQTSTQTHALTSRPDEVDVSKVAESEVDIGEDSGKSSMMKYDRIKNTSSKTRKKEHREYFISMKNILYGM